MRWFKKPEFDAPELNSPQPCAHGAGCNYMVKSKETGEMVPGCCAFVHPGEEGKGRHFFPAREVTNEDGTTRTQPACVRLTGGAGYYERRRERLSWADWCEREGIPYTPNPAGEKPAPPPRADRKGGNAPLEITPAIQAVINAAVQAALAGGAPPQRAPQTPQRKPRAANQPPRRVQQSRARRAFEVIREQIDAEEVEESSPACRIDGTGCENGDCPCDEEDYEVPPTPRA